MVETAALVEKGSSPSGGDTAESVATYLQAAVGKALAEAIVATIKAKPAEPALFLSRWLLRYVEESKRQLAAAEAHKAFFGVRAAAAARREAAAAAAAAVSHIDERGLSAPDRKALEALCGAEWVEEETMQDLLDHLRDRLGATGVYIAKYEEQASYRDGEGVPGLRYVFADHGHSYILNHCLFEEEGVTWDLLREDQLGVGAEESLQVSTEDDEGDEGVPSADEQSENPLIAADSTDGTSTVRHKSLFVEEVMDNPRIRFFGLTRPGSYIAVSFQFNDVASAASVIALCKWMQQKQQREKAIAAAQGNSEAAKSPRRASDGGQSDYSGGAAAAEGDSEEEEEVVDETDEPLPPVHLPSATATYILCADSLSKGSWHGQNSVRFVQAFAEEIARAFVRTQREAVERQANEMLDSTAREAAEQELADLQQKCSVRLQALEPQRQAEALQALEEHEAEEAREREAAQRAHDVRRGKRGSRSRKMQQDRDGNVAKARIGEVPDDRSLSSDEEESEAEDHGEGKVEFPAPLPRELVLEAAAAHAALEAFNEEVLTPFKSKLFLNRRYIADSPSLEAAAVGCALLLGHEAKTLKENPSAKDGRWSWDRLRHLLTPAFAEAMLAFDPKAPRHYTDSASSLQFIAELLEPEARDEEAQPEPPMAILLSSWASLAVRARRNELLLQRAKLKRAAHMQHALLPRLEDLDSDFKCLEEGEE